MRVGSHGVLIRGASGSGKSSLALALLYGIAAEAHLVADDRVDLEARDGRLFARPPATLAGLLEVRGQGVLRHPHEAEVALDLVADLLPLAACERLPEDDARRETILGVELRRIVLAEGAADNAARVVVALAPGVAVAPDAS